MKSNWKPAAVTAGAAAAFFVGELYLFLNPMFPFRFIDYALPLALVLVSAMGTWALFRSPAPVSARFLTAWGVTAAALFLAANAFVISEDGNPAALYYGGALWSTVPLAGMAALACGCAIRKSAKFAAQTAFRRGLILALGILLAAYAGWTAYSLARAV